MGLLVSPGLFRTLTQNRAPFCMGGVVEPVLGFILNFARLS